ncbi:phage minor tail protein L [Azospirillum canadense]|uniref:phage minor tail protein L n=1 Tax=Azospirillum canadense TaxID=403962 RepID=UPI002225C302|nr:phage minor tail protein L [Azospirillum canadense]MCW2242270.1 lambda family phage minor tail protein L [Azospirillum canadense]
MTTPTLPPALAAEAHSDAPDPIVTLYDLDTAVYGGGTYHFTDNSGNGAPIKWRGNDYQPFDLESEGWEWSGRGPLPTPRLRLTNANMLLSSLIATYDDLIGCRVTRWRTMARFLDTGATPSPGDHFPPDVYVIERKAVQTKQVVEFELSAALDQQGRMLPGRQVIRDSCTHTYRRWNSLTGGFDYSKASCPFAETGAGCYFDRLGNPVTDPSQDVCGKRLSDCRLRFNRYGFLFTRAFPGAGRVRGS